MATINRTDRLYVTILHGGYNAYTTEMSGLASLGEVYRQVKNLSSIESGVITLRLRNSTQGWTQQHNIIFKAKPINKPGFTMSEKPVSQSPSLFDSNL